MKRVIATISILMVLLPCLAIADVPQLLSYQGILTDSVGNSIEDNIHAVKFKIYEDSISEIAFWESDGFVPVQTMGGKFNHVLGSTNLLPDTLSKLSNLWLGISVGLADEIEPRALLFKVPKPKESTPLKQKKSKSEKQIALTKAQVDKFYQRVAVNPIALRKEQNGRPSEGLIFKVGIDMAGKHKISGLGLSGTENVKEGLSFGLILYMMNGSGTVKAGIGGELQISREQKDFDGDFNFNSLFFTLIAHPSINKNNVLPFFVGKLGYNFFNGNSEYKGTGYAEADLSGGVLLGFGGGLMAEKTFQFEAMYTLNRGKAEILGNNFNISYSKISISFGVIIDSKDY